MPRKRKDSEASNFSRSNAEAKNDENERPVNRWKCWSRSVGSTWSRMRDSFEKCQGFQLSDLTSYEKFVGLLYRPTDPASLGVARALFGFCMVLDVVEERGLADIDLKWGDPNGCHFPLIHGMERPPLPIMILIYAIMWLGAFGIMLGFWFKIACACFAIPYWYIFILDKSFWNNHTYLYGLVTVLFWGTGANRYFALDARFSKEKSTSVPLWNYFILKFQFFTLYFIAGLKKSSREWLEGYAMTNLSRHWVFDPFKSVLTTQQTDFLIVHWFGFIFDLTVGFFMLFPRTRIPAMVFCTAFHLMNSRLFSIGMFPYVCLATMPLFCSPDWPRKLKACLNGGSTCVPESSESSTENSQVEDSKLVESEEHLGGEKGDARTSSSEEIPSKATSSDEGKSGSDEGQESWSDDDGKKVKAWRDKINAKRKSSRVTKRQKFVVALLLVHVALQLFLPYSHFVTKGYNNWVPGLYGYSWDMMVHAWDIILIVIKVHDNTNNEDLFMNPQAWVPNDRWAKHGDMVHQHAQCLKKNLMRQKERALRAPQKTKDIEKWTRLSSNLSIYIDVWCSLNGRFQQRIFNPKVDMLAVDWHPFKPISYLMPLMTGFSSYRHKLDEIQSHVYTWSNYTDVFFVADYPGMQLENYISNDFSNVSVTVLEGSVTYEEEGWKDKRAVAKGDSVSVKTGKFHSIETTSAYPSCYMYTYTNETRQETDIGGSSKSTEKKYKALLPAIVKELEYKVNAWLRAIGHITNSFFHLVYGFPMIRRVRHY
ncbi:vitamin K-dependent gamma-carboxylase isoform X2 [Venturia canescens]|uniref:vitamin K-dependent gamma-carboxylase isoform X2 n=1 Tax=Venturia canescens TaxID=32260 RepID=UPI001C9C74BA|nr:vitamin K-dependent gamma-carboxylase isoform X2 [Venturia canescens]